jgi:hypothetical protein
VQAAQCDGRSPLYARLCRAFAEDPVAAAIVGSDPSWDAPLRLLGGLHYLVLGREASWDDPLERHAAFLTDFVRTQRVQTNEVQRSWILLPLFLRAARFLADGFDLVELGSSAGLNLVWDRYRYSYAAGGWGAREARVRLTGEERSPVPAGSLARAVRIRRRVGIDLAPVDVTTDDGARLLRSFVWAGQPERLERLDRAIETVCESPPVLVRGDVGDELPNVLEDRPTLVFETAVLGYLDDATLASIRRTLARARAPVAFVSAGRPRNDVEAWGMRIVTYPGGGREFVGHADFHGAWLDYRL